MVFVAYSAWAQADENVIRSSSASTTYPSPSLIGEWGLASTTSINSDGKREELKLSSSYGLLSIDPNGNYTLQVILLQRMHGSSGETQSASGGDHADVTFESYAHFGQVYINGTNLRMHVIHASLPAWNGTDLDSPFIFRHGQLIFTVSLPSGGNSKGLDVEAVWRRSAPQATAIVDEATRDCTNRTHPIHEWYSVGESRIDK
jgi:lipocalin-like protein